MSVSIGLGLWTFSPFGLISSHFLKTKYFRLHLSYEISWETWTRPRTREIWRLRDLDSTLCQTDRQLDGHTNKQKKWLLELLTGQKLSLQKSLIVFCFFGASFLSSAFLLSSSFLSSISCSFRALMRAWYLILTYRATKSPNLLYLLFLVILVPYWRLIMFEITQHIK